MSFLIEEYDIPFIGKIQLLEGTGYDKSFYGKYYASNEKLGKGFCKEFSNMDKLKKEVKEKIEVYFKAAKSIYKETIEKNIEETKRKINKLESSLSDLEHEGFLDRHRTSNALQIEFQTKAVPWN